MNISETFRKEDRSRLPFDEAANWIRISLSPEKEAPLKTKIPASPSRSIHPQRTPQRSP